MNWIYFLIDPRECQYRERQEMSVKLIIPIDFIMLISIDFNNLVFSTRKLETRIFETFFSNFYDKHIITFPSTLSTVVTEHYSILVFTYS